MTDATIVRARPQQIWQDLGGEAVILDLEAGAYYGLNAVGTRIWNLIQAPRSIAELRETLLSEFDVDADRCNRDLERLLQELETRRMIERVEAGA